MTTTTKHGKIIGISLDINCKKLKTWKNIRNNYFIYWIIVQECIPQRMKTNNVKFTISTDFCQEAFPPNRPREEEPLQSRTEALSWKDRAGIARRLRGLKLTGKNKRKGSYTDNDFLKSVLGFHSVYDQIVSCECVKRDFTPYEILLGKEKTPGSLKNTGYCTQNKFKLQLIRGIESYWTNGSFSRDP